MNPFRSEAAMFRVLVWTVSVFLVALLVVAAVRAVT